MVEISQFIFICSKYNINDIYCFSGGADAKSYVIISQLPAEVYRKYVEDVNTSHLTGFTFVVISIVHLAGGKIAEGSAYYCSNYKLLRFWVLTFIKPTCQDVWDSGNLPFSLCYIFIDHLLSRLSCFTSVKLIYLAGV